MNKTCLFNVVTIFPEIIQVGCHTGITGQAFAKNIAKLNIINPRNFTTDIHQSVDDRPFGGGDGMIMLYEPLKKAIESLNSDKGKVVYLSPQGKPWNDQFVRSWSESAEQKYTLICGRYGGVDQRIINNVVDEEISIGDFILSGGELGALIMIDSILRMIPGVLGNQASPHQETFSNNLFECPQFTRPRDIEGLTVPEVLLSGNHKKIDEFKLNVSIVLTWIRRPDLIREFKYSKEKIISSFKYVSQLDELEISSLGLNLDELKNHYKKINVE